MTLVKAIQKGCLEGRLGIADAISQIDKTIGGITRVDFKSDKKFKIANHNTLFALDVNGMRNKQIDRLHGMAVVAYFRAQKNGNIQPGEVHISREASTKHHMDGIYRIFNKYST